MVIPYLFNSPNFECKIEGKWVSCTEDTGACDIKYPVKILTPKSSTISADFNLYCDGRSARVFISSMPLFAGIVGIFTFGYVADSFGRRTAIKACWIIGGILSIFFNFSTNMISLAIGNFGIGFSALVL